MDSKGKKVNGRRGGSRGSMESKVSINESDVTSGTLLANNTLVLGKLFKYLDDRKDLFKFRLVSRLWNEELVRLLTANPNSFRCDEDEQNQYRINCDLTAMSKTKTGNKTLKKFDVLLEQSKYPELLMKNVSLSHEVLDGFNDRYTPVCEEILGKYGKHVKKLKVKDDKDLEVLNKCLGLCPKVEKLSLQIDKSEDDYFLQPFVPKIYGNVKKLKFSYDPEGFEGVLQVFGWILDSCPAIEYLKIETGSEDNEEMHSFTKVLQAKPEITKNIKELHLEGEILQNFYVLCGVKLENLKKLSFCENEDIETEMELEHIEAVGVFGRFFEGVGNTLEELTITLWNYGILDIPHLANLKELTLSSCAEHEYLHSFDFLKKFPSLKRIYLIVDVGGMESLDEMLNGCWVDPTDPSVINGSLEYLKMGNMFDVDCPLTIKNLNIAFPKLAELEINIKYSQRGSEDFFKEIFKNVSEIGNLKVFVVSFRGWDCGKIWVDLDFSLLKNAPSLEELRLNVFEGEQSKMVASSLPQLFGAPKLRKVLFKYSPRKLNNRETFKFTITSIKKGFAEHNVQFEVVEKIKLNY